MHKLGITWPQLGMAAGLLAAVACTWAEIQLSGPITASILMLALGAGVVSVLVWGNDLRERCDRYERLLRKHGIDPLETLDPFSR